MSRKRRLAINEETTDVVYANWLAQMLAVMMPCNLYLIAGRASAKTVQVLVERVTEVVYDCPGAPFAWVADTYSDLHKNIIPSLMDGLQFVGWVYGKDYVIDEKPPQEWQDRMYKKVRDFKGMMVFSTGFSFTFISLDRPSIGAGNSYVGVFGDEVKYFAEEKITNLLKAVRGYRLKYGDSPWYRSRTFVTDMPNPNHIGEHDWILKLSKQNDRHRINVLLKAGFVYNETKLVYVDAQQKLAELEEAAAPANQITEARKKLDTAAMLMNRWERMWKKARTRSSFFFITSSYVNADILGMDWFSDEFAAAMEGIECNILSIIPKLEAGQRFYCNLKESNFYADGNKNHVIERHELGWVETCEVLNYLNPNRPIDGGMDAGNMLSMVFGQQDGKVYHVFKELYTLPPETVRELGDKFIDYFRPHRVKVLRLYYDRSMNSYRKVNADMATQIKRAIEYDRDGRRTGWAVQMMSLGQGDIPSNTEYRFFSDLLADNLKFKLFTLKIDRTNCPNLKSEMEVTRTKISSGPNTSGLIVKEKSGDKLPTARLPKESTNLTDALKYLIMRKVWISVWDNRGGTTTTSAPGM